MKNAILFFVLFLSTLSILFFVDSKSETDVLYPIPTSGTMIKGDMEDKNLKSDRHKWIEAMHQSSEDIHWKDIEYRTSIERQNNSSNLASTSRNGKISVADGSLNGEWIERGSNNQAGSVFDIEYDLETNELFLVSAGGSIFKTDFYLQYWEVVNDRFTFSPGLLKMVTLEDGSKRLLGLINKEPHYSDDRGLTWQAAAAYQSDNWGQVKDAFVTEIGGEELVFILAKTGYWSDFYLYVSRDKGKTYQSIKHFFTSDSGNLAMAKIKKTGEIYIIEQTNINESKIHRYDSVSQSLVTIQNNSPVAFGENGRGNLAGALVEEEGVKLLAYNENNELYSSIDTGLSWNYLSTIPINPWDVRLFVSAENPELLLTGGVECYRSINGGESWVKINGWGEYYGDVTYKLHADIMEFDEFFDQDGNSFVTISNHGGLSISYDNTMTNTNIGLFDLNVSQYYSVRTSPRNSKFIMAGAQDQGLQRGTVYSSNTANLDQVISGDYGHNVFTKGGQRFWTVYPGGWISHYSNPELGYLDASWELNSSNETVWIPPIIEGPDLELDQILLAGGNMNGGSGSHVIKLTYQNGSIQKDQLPVDFYAKSGSEISALAISPLNRDKWYVATNNGKFYYSIDAGQSYQLANNNVPGSHYLYGACILPSKIDENTIYLSGSGYSTAGVQKSTDGGKNFGAMINNLPTTLVFGLAANEDETIIFAATEAGPYVFLKESGQWYDLAGDIAPTQSYWSVEYVEETKTARFATYGRGIWDFNVDDSGVNVNDLALVKNNLKIYPNPVDDRLTMEHPKSADGEGIVTIMDVQGKVLFNKKLHAISEKTELDIAFLKAGSYYIMLQTKHEKSSGKFIKR